MKKQNLPFKICLVCKKQFSWRKKWRLNWDRVNTAPKDAHLNKFLNYLWYNF